MDVFLKSIIEIINFINDQFKDYKIRVFVEEKGISYLNSNNNWLGDFYLETNKFYISVWFYINLMKHFKNQDEMNDFIKPIIKKIIGRLLNQVI